MQQTYEAVMKDDRIVKWIGEVPPFVNEGRPDRVLITILEELPSESFSEDKKSDG